MKMLLTITEHQIANAIIQHIHKSVRNELEDFPTKLREAIGMLETAMITASLEKFGGNQVKAANELGLQESTLRFKMKKRNISAKYQKGN